MILLVNDQATDAKVGMPGRVWNEAAPPRYYQAKGHYLELEGPGHVISYDAEEICKIPGWRLATTQEQNAYMAAKRKAARLEEAAPPLAPALEAVEVSPAPSAPEAPPAPAAEKPQTLTTATAPKSAAGKDN